MVLYKALDFRRVHLCWQEVRGHLERSHFNFINLNNIDFSGTTIEGDISFVHGLHKLANLNLENTQAAVRVAVQNCKGWHPIGKKDVSVALAR